jgi:hypothetical protein
LHRKVARDGPVEQRIPLNEPEHQGRTSELAKGGGCFVASAVYDSPLAPEVAAFRRFRDEVLVMSTLGRYFIRVYHITSPTVASLISKHRLLKTATRRLFLEPILVLINRRR